jgi:hypothetical protein
MPWTTTSVPSSLPQTRSTLPQQPVPSPIPPTTNPIERLAEEKIPPDQWYARWLERYLPKEEDQHRLCLRFRQILSLPEGMEKDTAAETFLPYPLPQVPIPGRFPHFWKRWESAGANPYIVETIRRGMQLDWIKR